MVRWLTWIHGQPWGTKVKAELPDINVGAVHSMFVAAGRAGYVTTTGSKEVVVAFYAFNGTYAKFEEGIAAFPRRRKCSPRFSRPTSKKLLRGAIYGKARNDLRLGRIGLDSSCVWKRWRRKGYRPRPVEPVGLDVGTGVLDVGNGVFDTVIFDTGNRCSDDDGNSARTDNNERGPGSLGKVGEVLAGLQRGPAVHSAAERNPGL
jgi:hypothetical protein